MHGVQEIALRERCARLGIYDALDVLARKQHGAPTVVIGAEERQLAILLGEIFEDVSLCPHCLGRARLEKRR